MHLPYMQPRMRAWCIQTAPYQAEAAHTSGGSSGSDSEEEEDGKKQKKQAKKSKRKHKHKESRDKKRSKKDADAEPLVCWLAALLGFLAPTSACSVLTHRPPLQSVTEQYGRYGVIRDSDMYR